MNSLHIKPDLQGTLIYGTMAAFSLCFLASVTAARIDAAKKRMWSVLTSGTFVFAFLLSVVAVVYRGLQVGHLPMQNLFEVFLFLGACIGPIHWFSGKIMGRTHPAFTGVDAMIALIVLFPAGFVFPGRPQPLPPALQSWLFGPHVAAYMLAYIFMAKASVFAAVGVIVPSNSKAMTLLSDYIYKLVLPGFGLLTVGLFLGSVWGKLAWGDWWGWDPKELWSLVGWLVYGIYFHVRLAWPQGRRLHNGLVLLGMVVIIITLLWANLSKLFPGLHNYAV